MIGHYTTGAKSPHTKGVFNHAPCQWCIGMVGRGNSKRKKGVGDPEAGDMFSSAFGNSSDTSESPYGLPSESPYGPPAGPPSGPPAGPPSGPPAGPPSGPPAGPPSGPPPGVGNTPPPGIGGTPPLEELPMELEQPNEEEQNAMMDKVLMKAANQVSDTDTATDQLVQQAVDESQNTESSEIELERLRAEVERLRQGMSGAAEIIEEIENTPHPPIVEEGFVVPSHIVGDFVRLGRLLHRDGLVHSCQGSMSLLNPDEAGVFHSTRHEAVLGSLTDADIVSGRLGQKAPDAANRDWRIHEVMLAFASLQNNGPAACIHVYAPNAVALSLQKDLIVIEPKDMSGQRVFGKALIIDPDYDNIDDYLRQLTEALKQGNGRIVVSRGHGVYSVGKNFDEAWKWAASLEKSCQLIMLARQAGIRI